MKCVVLIAILVFGACAAKEIYSSKPSDVTSNETIVDVELVLADKERLKNIFTCFLEEECNNELLKVLKVEYPKTVAEACKSCSDKEKHALRRFLEVSEQTYPDQLKALKKKTDPENMFYHALSEVIANA